MNVTRRGWPTDVSIALCDISLFNHVTSDLDAQRADNLRQILAPVDHIEKRELTSDAPWRTSVRIKLRVIGVKQEELAVWVGTPSQSTISNILKAPDDSEDLRRSEYVERISVALRLPLPYLARVELALRPLIRIGSIKALENVVAHLESYAEMALEDAKADGGPDGQGNL